MTAPDDNAHPVVYIKDTSSNGTYLNAQPMKRNEEVLLNEGDVITLPSQEGPPPHPPPLPHTPLRNRQRA